MTRSVPRKPPSIPDIRVALGLDPRDLWAELVMFANTGEDATPILQEIIDNGGGAFPQGTFTITKPLRVTRDDTYIVGLHANSPTRLSEYIAVASTLLSTIDNVLVMSCVFSCD